MTLFWLSTRQHTRSSLAASTGTLQITRIFAARNCFLDKLEIIKWNFLSRVDGISRGFLNQQLFLARLGRISCCIQRLARHRCLLEVTRLFLLMLGSPVGISGLLGLVSMQF